MFLLTLLGVVGGLLSGCLSYSNNAKLENNLNDNTLKYLGPRKSTNLDSETDQDVGPPSQTASVVWDFSLSAYSVKQGFDTGALAWAKFGNSINKTGWSYLEVYTNGSHDDLKQAYAAGFIEGIVSRDLINMHWYNTYDGYCKKPFSAFCQRLQKYLDTNMAWVSSQIATKADKDPYWHQVQLFYEQLAGLRDALKGKKGKPSSPSKYYMDVTDISLTQISGDLEDLQTALGGEGAPVHVKGSGSCSALIKLLPGNKDLYAAHDTWDGYNSMLRVQKKYDFQFHQIPGGKPVAAQTMTFSSYPGLLMSGDDFYVMSSGMVSIETTIGNNNSSLWKYVTPENAVLEGIRNMVANRLATTGKDWADIFSKYNSGTYNNEWLIVNYNKFTPGQPLPDGVLYVLDQIPGMIVAKDMTQYLQNKTYFPSYNLPYFPEVFNASGHWPGVHKYGDWFTYDHTPRANIFRRDHVNVKNIETMTNIMRYNDFYHDPLSRCKCSPPYSGENAISARCDLNPADGKYPFPTLGHRSHGGTDMKLTSLALSKQLEFVAVSSPTYDQVPPFQWSKTDFGQTTRHVGHPDLWKFPPEVHAWGSRG